ncbi:acyl-CoA hydrolase 2-like isoform X2 [Vicia villosa]|uniref:acyl-CoA hydrolase 2-like isoform X2 n=1 Tax=Vicia villosa TaxID=3911 RepID=UPI00273C68DB|nr:acyl-CoA hydrolase 2-like isoform X2 [Vicia villosa]
MNIKFQLGLFGLVNLVSVLEFLACVPLLHRLPSSSLKNLSQLLIVKSYEIGEYVVREGEPGEGLYIIWEGEAKVIRPGIADDENDLEFQLKRYDYFGSGLSNAVHRADVVALTKLSCLVLPREHSVLLQAKFIGSAEKSHETCSLVERILHLEPIMVDIFQEITPSYAQNYGNVFGGQLVGQALAAASKSVDRLKVAHSLHAYFLRAGDSKIPIQYKVKRLRDGRSFATRKVNAIQKEKVIFTLLASFQNEELGFQHQEVSMPSVPTPDELLSMEELREQRLIDPRLPMTFRNKIATAEFVPWPIEIRFCEPRPATNQTKSPPSLRYWFRSKGKLSDDQALHRCVAAFTSDLIFLNVSMNPHRGRGIKMRALSLNHSMWFHRPFRADEWVLYVIFSPTSFNARGFVTGQMFNQKGELLVSLVQEGLTMKYIPKRSAANSKL